jgi:hypothetical protein
MNKKIIYVVVGIVILGFLIYQNNQRQKELDQFIQMQQAPMKQAEEIKK